MNNRNDNLEVLRASATFQLLSERLTIIVQQREHLSRILRTIPTNQEWYDTMLQTEIEVYNDLLARKIDRLTTESQKIKETLTQLREQARG